MEDGKLARYGVRIRRGDRELEVWGSTEFVETQLERLGSQQLVSQEAKLPSMEKTLTGAKEFSLAEFLRQTEPSNHFHRITSIGYFLEKVRGQSAFTRVDIVKAYEEAKERYSSIPNVYRDVGKCVSRGLLMQKKGESSGEESYVVTSSGDKWVEERLALSRITN